MSKRHDQTNSLLRDLVAEFLNEHKALGTLITVTRCEVADNFKTATCFLTIFPQASAKSGLTHAKTQLHNLREWLRDKINWRSLPVLDFSLDKGDK